MLFRILGTSTLCSKWIVILSHKYSTRVNKTHHCRWFILSEAVILLRVVISRSNQFEFITFRSFNAIGCGENAYFWVDFNSICNSQASVVFMLQYSLQPIKRNKRDNFYQCRSWISRKERCAYATVPTDEKKLCNTNNFTSAVVG